MLSFADLIIQALDFSHLFSIGYGHAHYHRPLALKARRQLPLNRIIVEQGPIQLIHERYNNVFERRDGSLRIFPKTGRARACGV